MSNRIQNSIRVGIFAAILVGIATYMAEGVHSRLAGLIITIPVALPSLWFLTTKHNKPYAQSFFTGISLYFLAACLFYYLHVKKHLEMKRSIEISVAFWLISAIIVYTYILK